MPKALISRLVPTSSMLDPICSNQDSILNRKLLPGTKSADEYIQLPDIGNTSVQVPPPETVKQSWRDGHHFGVLCCMISSIVVLLINVLACILAVSEHEVVGDLAILYYGDCDKVKRLDLWLHLLINILSTMLLGASNYSMQCVSAPTRTDIDNAHRKHLWMDIGVPSVRNLRFISWPRKILWCCLILSSVPLHLMYNSVIYSSTSLSNAGLFVVTSDFLAGAPYDPTNYTPVYDFDADVLYKAPDIPAYNYSAVDFRLSRLKNPTSSVRLDIPECQKAFGSTPLTSRWSDVLAVTPTASTNTSLLLIGYSDLGIQLFCGANTSICDRSSITFTPEEGQQEYSISYCRGFKTPQRCKVGITLGLMIGVIACNLVEIICMGYIVLRLDPRPLVTLGDAVASFLDSPGQYQWFPQIGLHTFGYSGRTKTLAICLRYLVNILYFPLRADIMRYQILQRLASASFRNQSFEKPPKDSSFLGTIFRKDICDSPLLAACDGSQCRVFGLSPSLQLHFSSGRAKNHLHTMAIINHSL